MEYVFVDFDPDDPRDVLADGSVIGRTRTLLLLPSNYYVITLSGDPSIPPCWTGLVAGTTEAAPLTIRFGNV
jgi:hypothetical protein